MLAAMICCAVLFSLHGVVTLLVVVREMLVPLLRRKTKPWSEWSVRSLWEARKAFEPFGRFLRIQLARSKLGERLHPRARSGVHARRNSIGRGIDRL